MATAANAEPLNIRISGPAFEPADPLWHVATPRERLDYWDRVGEIALEVKKAEIRRGIGKNGRKLKPVKMRYRKDGATGPPLIPHVEESRTIRLLAAHPMVNGVTLYWKSDAGKSWRRILGYHAYKHGPRSLPVRNTIGITPAGLKAIARRSRAEWRKDEGDGTGPLPQPGAGPKPLPGPRTTPTGPERLPGQAARPRPPGTRPGLFLGKRPEPPTLGQVEANLGVRFKPSYAAKLHKDVTVIVDPAKLDAALAADSNFYVAKGGTGAAIAGRYQAFQGFLAKARATFGKAKQIAIEMARMALDVFGGVNVRDGRHRFAVLRDEGAKAIPVSVPRADAVEFRLRYGVTKPIPAPPAPAPVSVPRPKTGPQVVYLPRGAKPNPLSRKIQVYDSSAGPAPPPPPRAARPMGPKPVPAAPAGHVIRPDEADAFTAGSAYRATLYHRTTDDRKAELLARGLEPAKAGAGVMGDGLYLSSRPEKQFGPAQLNVVVNLKQPLVGHYVDVQKTLAEWVAADGADPALGTRAYNLALAKRGYDGVIGHFDETYQGETGMNWVVVTEPATARFVVRP